MPRASFWMETVRSSSLIDDEVLDLIDPKIGLDDLVVEIEILNKMPAQKVRAAILGGLADFYQQTHTDPRVLLKRAVDWDRRTIAWVAIVGARDVVDLIPRSGISAERTLVSLEHWITGKAPPKTVLHYLNQARRVWLRMETSAGSYATNACVAAGELLSVPAEQLEPVLQSVYSNARMAHDFAEMSSDVDALTRGSQYEADQIRTIARAILTLPVRSR